MHTDCTGMSDSFKDLDYTESNNKKGQAMLYKIKLKISVNKWDFPKL